MATCVVSLTGGDPVGQTPSDVVRSGTCGGGGRAPRFRKCSQLLSPPPSPTVAVASVAMVSVVI